MAWAAKTLNLQRAEGAMELLELPVAQPLVVWQARLVPDFALAALAYLHKTAAVH